MDNNGYLVYIDDVLLPITPSNITTKIKNQNQTISLIDGSEINILESAGLTEIDFTFVIPQITKYPFARYQNNEFKDVFYYTKKLEDLKVNKQPFQFKVIRRSPTGGNLYDTNMTVSIEEYGIVDDVDNGFDVSVNVKLKQYIPYKTKKLVLASTNTNTNTNSNTVAVNTAPPRTTTKTIPDTYVVKAGDTLWAIAKKYLGNGQKYKEIAKLNNITNPNLIYPNQVLRLK